MTQTKWIRLLTLILISALSVLTAIASFLSPEKALNKVSGGFYIALWCMLLLLYIVQLWTKQKRPSFFFTHIAFFLLLCSVLLAFSSTQSISVSLSEGESISLSDYFEEANGTVLLRNFSLKTILTNGKALEFYHADLEYGEEIFRASANAPKKIAGLHFHVFSHRIFLTDFSFEASGETFSVMKNGILIEEQSGLYPLSDSVNLSLFPFDSQNEQILYFYELLSSNKDPIESGLFFSENLPETLTSIFNFKITEEETQFEVGLLIKKTPFHFLLAISATLFLIALILDFYILPAGGKNAH